MLLSLATGSGKTIIAANLLWRLHEAERLPKPALFLCDRDELREQAYSKLRAVYGDNARIVKTEKGENAAKNARVSAGSISVPATHGLPLCRLASSATSTNAIRAFLSLL